MIWGLVHCSRPHSRGIHGCFFDDTHTIYVALGIKVKSTFPPWEGSNPGSTNLLICKTSKDTIPLRKWIGFEQDEHRHISIVEYSPSGQPRRVGDGTGIQGRFQQSVGQTMSPVFGSLRYDLAFADFEIYTHSY